MTDQKIHDLIIIGGGPAGLTAAIYASRRALDTLVLTKDIGGQAAQTTEIENYPGFDSISGPELMNKFHKQAEKYGAKFIFQGVTNISQDETTKIYTITTAKGEYRAYAIILAFGLEHRKLKVPGELEYYGKGVTYCATCDGPFFKNKEICVVGGGSSALDAILYMSKLATKVHSFVRGEAYRGEEILVDEVKYCSNDEIHFKTSFTEIKGESMVKEVIVKDAKTGAEKTMPMQGIFVEIGYQPNITLYKDLVDLSPAETIIVDQDCRTSRPGFFAAGDITTISFKQVISSGGQGCIAALSAYSYIMKQKGIERKIGADWSKK